MEIPALFTEFKLDQALASIGGQRYHFKVLRGDFAPFGVTLTTYFDV